MRVSKNSQFAGPYDVILAEDSYALEAFVLHALLTVKVPKDFLEANEYESADIELPQDFVAQGLAAAAYAEEKKIPRIMPGITYPCGRWTGPDEDLRTSKSMLNRRKHQAFRRMVREFKK